MDMRGDVRISAKRFEDLVVWQKAHQFVLAIYHLSKSLPRDEQYALAMQMKRSAMSVPANIAEGFKKKSKPDKARFMNIAQGSLEESRYYLILIRDLGYGDVKIIMDQLEEVSKLLAAYTASILASDS